MYVSVPTNLFLVYFLFLVFQNDGHMNAILYVVVNNITCTIFNLGKKSHVAEANKHKNDMLSLHTFEKSVGYVYNPPENSEEF